MFYTVNITYTTKWFDDDEQGLAMGIFGAGNAGAALTKFVAHSPLTNWYRNEQTD